MPAEHVGDDDPREVDVGYVPEPGVVHVLRQAGGPAAWNEDPRPGGAVAAAAASGEVGEERAAELVPLGVPLEGVAGAAEGEELVPVLLAGEVGQGLQDRQFLLRRLLRH